LAGITAVAAVWACLARARSATQGEAWRWRRLLIAGAATVIAVAANGVAVSVRRRSWCHRMIRMITTTILVIDDEAQIRRVVRNTLADDEVRVIEAGTGEQGIDRAAAERPDLIILDLGLPDIAGLSVCREIRKWSGVPIVVLSARHSESEKVALLDAGADDYVTKPFGGAELHARVRAQLRRARSAARPGGEGPVSADGLEIDLARRSVARDGAEIHLTPTEWDLLRFFVAEAGRTLTHEQIFRAVWGRGGGDAQTYLRVHLANLRRKIERDHVRPALILTEPGVGYRFRALD
jgi:two-component system, OmpR family, KDP operon response regulator KdpE